MKSTFSKQTSMPGSFDQVGIDLRRIQQIPMKRKRFSANKVFFSGFMTCGHPPSMVNTVKAGGQK